MKRLATTVVAAFGMGLASCGGSAGEDEGDYDSADASDQDDAGEQDNMVQTVEGPIAPGSWGVSREGESVTASYTSPDGEVLLSLVCATPGSGVFTVMRPPASEDTRSDDRYSLMVDGEGERGQLYLSHGNGPEGMAALDIDTLNTEFGRFTREGGRFVFADQRNPQNEIGFPTSSEIGEPIEACQAG